MINKKNYEAPTFELLKHLLYPTKICLSGDPEENLGTWDGNWGE